MENCVTNNNLTKNNVKVVVPLKYLSNFWIRLNIPLINCEVELILTWFRNCALIDKLTREANYDAGPDVYENDNPENVQKTFKKHYKLIATDLSKQIKLKYPQQISFIGKLSRRSGATIFFIIEKSEETTFEFSQNSVNIL